MADSSPAAALEKQGADEDTVPPSVEELPLEEGSFVQLYSLNAQKLNDKIGEVIGYDEAAVRYQVVLDQNQKKAILVKPVNLRRIPLQPLAIRIETDKRANQAAVEMQNASRRQDPQIQNVLDTLRLTFQQCIKKDRCCVMAHAGLGQVYTMSQKPKQALIHFKRAIAQLHADVPRNSQLDQRRFRNQLIYELAVCHGGLRMADKEEVYLRQLLEESPDFVAAHLALGQSLSDQGRLDEAIEVLQAIVDQPEDGNPWIPASQIRQLKGHARKLLVEKLDMRLSQLSNPLAANDEKTLAYVKQLLALVDSREPDTPERQVSAMMEGRESDAIDFAPDRRARVFAFCAAALTRLGRFDEAQVVLEVANELESSPLYTLPAKVKAFVQFQEGQLHEARGDAASLELEAREYWEKAKAAYVASNVSQVDPATCSMHMRVQLKLNPNLETAFSPDGASALAINVGNTTELTTLPQRPMEPEEKANEPDADDHKRV